MWTRESASSAPFSRHVARNSLNRCGFLSRSCANWDSWLVSRYTSGILYDTVYPPSAGTPAPTREDLSRTLEPAGDLTRLPSRLVPAPPPQAVLGCTDSSTWQPSCRTSAASRTVTMQGESQNGELESSWGRHRVVASTRTGPTRYRSSVKAQNCDVGLQPSFCSAFSAIGNASLNERTRVRPSILDRGVLSIYAKPLDPKWSAHTWGLLDQVSRAIFKAFPCSAAKNLWWYSPA